MSPDPGSHVTNFGKISSNSHECIVFARFYGSLPVVTLTFNLLTPKSNQHTYHNL